MLTSDQGESTGVNNIFRITFGDKWNFLHVVDDLGHVHLAKKKNDQKKKKNDQQKMSTLLMEKFI